MFTQMKKRKYTKTLRAENQEQTRERIVEAAMLLHETVGPAHTSIKAVAEQAGVQRLTVYRHFPDDISLFQACTSHWLELNPPPQPEIWSGTADPLQAIRLALQNFYRYYRQTQAMWRASYRDVDQVVALQLPMQEFENYLDQTQEALAGNWKIAKKKRDLFKKTLRHGLRFSTWESLQRENLSDTQMAELVITWLKGVVL